MESAISEIIGSIPNNNTFDAHAVIAMLIEQYPDIYNLHKKEFSTKATYHSHISKIIKRIVTAPYPLKHYSLNSNGNYTLNNVYEK
jgi:hypothetical protein